MSESGRNRILAALAIGFGVLALLHAHSVLRKVAHADALAGLVACAIFCIALLRWGSTLWKRRLLGALGMLAIVELLLQGLALFSLIPGLDTFDTVPFGRLYWTREGFSNDILNRHGWHDRAVGNDSRTPRLLLVGDSFVEARHVDTSETLGVRLEAALARASAPADVVAIGLSGASPSQYLDLLDYGIRHYLPNPEGATAVVSVFLGNDFTDVHHGKDAGISPRRYRFLADGNGGLRLHPAHKAARQRFIAALDYRHEPLIFHVPRLLKSHLLLPDIYLSLRERIRGQATVHRHRDADGAQDEAGVPGVKAFVLHSPPSPDLRQAMATVGAHLRAWQALTRRHGMHLCVMTIPLFPPAFYTRAQGDHRAHYAWPGYDLLQTERDLASRAAASGIPLLAMGQRMQAEQIPPDTIRSLYLAQGSGHLSASGHAFFASRLAQWLTTVRPNNRSGDRAAAAPPR